MKRLQPHGLNLGFQTEVLNAGKKSKFLKSKLEAYVRITNSVNGKVVVLPMRSFVNTFIVSLRGFLYGGTNPKASTAIRSVSANGAGTFGMFIGTGTTGVQLSQTALVIKASSASIAYGATSFIPPGVDLPIAPSGAAPSGEDPVFLGDGSDPTGGRLPSGNTLSYPGITRTKISRIFTNTLGVTFTVKELGLIAQASRASDGAPIVATMLSRDIVDAGQPGAPAGVGVPAGAAITFDFEFILQQSPNGYGGAVLNLSRLVYNFLIKGNQNDQPLIDINSNGITLTQSSLGATLGASAGDITASTALQVRDQLGVDGFIGIVVGRYNTADQSGKNAIISPGDTTFNVTHTGLTVGTCLVSAITNPYSNASQFTVIRDFTNTTTTAIYLDRIGLVNKGTSSNPGTSMVSGQAFYAINKPSGGYIELQPSQTLRVTYTFGIKV